MRRLLWVAMTAAVVSFFAFASAATAATPAPVQRLITSLTPTSMAGYPPEPEVVLLFKPVTVTVQGVDYRWRLDVEQYRDPFSGRDTSVYSDLYRKDGSLVQEHSYGFDTYEDVSLTLDRTTLATANLDTGAAFAPSVLQGSFAASGAATAHSCTLTNGRAGHSMSAAGTVSWSQFAIDTGTSPFFGVLANGPAAATLIYDPGCGGGSSGPGFHGPYPCPGKRSLAAQSRFGRTAFFDETNYAGTRSFLAAVAASSFSQESNNFHIGYELNRPGSDLTVPRHGRHGAVAHFLTAQSSLMTGSATFHSYRAPRRTRWHTCRSHGRLHRFRELRYRGRLTPDADPLTALLDTGDLTLARPLRAGLVIVQYQR